VARNHLIDHFRGKTKQRSADPLSSSLVELQTAPSQRIARNEEERFVLEALSRIPLDAQLLLELYYWQSLSGPELAAVFEIPEGTLRGRLRRAKSLLRAEVDAVTRSGVALEDTLTRLADWKHQPADA
jgi:RNA polymerase sigma-70 factor (ECF subfamily)